MGRVSEDRRSSQNKRAQLDVRAKNAKKRKQAQDYRELWRPQHHTPYYRPNLSNAEFFAELSMNQPILAEEQEHLHGVAVVDTFPAQAEEDIYYGNEHAYNFEGDEAFNNNDSNSQGEGDDSANSPNNDHDYHEGVATKEDEVLWKAEDVVQTREQLTKENLDNRTARDENWLFIIPYIVNYMLGNFGKCTCSSDATLSKRLILFLSVDKPIFYETVEYCKCDGALPIALLHRGYFPSTPITPNMAFNITSLEFFHEVHMTTALTSHGWATNLRRHATQRSKFSVPDLTKLWQYSYMNWVEANRRFKEEVDRKAKQICEEKGNKWGRPNDLAELCPSCFYRDPTDYGPENPIYVGADGNSQHYRVKGTGKVNPQENKPPEYTNFVKRVADPQDTEKAPLPPKSKKPQKPVLEKSDQERKGNWRYLDEAFPEGESSCAHVFAAAEASKKKSKKFEGHDETGLINLVCRHGACLRLENMFLGERRYLLVNLYKNLIEELPGDAHVFFQYDLACQLGARFRDTVALSPEQKCRVQVLLNAFHSFAHALECQMRYGPHRALGIALTDGEFVERFWSLVRHLVVSGRTSSAAHRAVTLWLASLHHATIGRITRGHHLKVKLNRAEEMIKAARPLLHKAGFHLAYHEQLSSESNQSHDANQATANSTAPAPTLDNACLICEDQTKAGASKMIAQDNHWDELVNQIREVAAKQKAWFAMKQQAFKAAYADHPYVDLYKLMVAELKEKKRLDDHRKDYPLNSSSFLFPDPVPERKNGGTSDRVQSRRGRTRQQIYQDARKRVDDELARTNQKRSDWASGSKLLEEYKVFEAWKEILSEDAVYQRIHAARLMELWAIRKRNDCSGSKNVGSMSARIRTRTKAMLTQAAKIQRLLDNLPGQTSPIQFVPYNINSKNDEELVEANGERLWKFHYFQSVSLGLELTKEFAFESFAKQFLNDSCMLNGINAVHRYDRAIEEISLLKREWTRTARWATAKLVNLDAVLRQLTEPYITEHLSRELMDVLASAVGLIAQCPDRMCDKQVKLELMVEINLSVMWVDGFRQRDNGGKHGGSRPIVGGRKEEEEGLAKVHPLNEVLTRDEARVKMIEKEGFQERFVETSTGLSLDGGVGADTSDHEEAATALLDDISNMRVSD